MKQFYSLLLVILVFLAGFGLSRLLAPPQTPGSQIALESKLHESKDPGAGGNGGLAPPVPIKGTLKAEPPLMASQGQPGPGSRPPVRQFPRVEIPPALGPEDSAALNEMAASMRQSGMPEADIQNILESLKSRATPTLEESYSPYEPAPSELSPEEIKAQMRAALENSGFPPEEIEQIVESSLPIIQQDLQTGPTLLTQ